MTEAEKYLIPGDKTKDDWIAAWYGFDRQLVGVAFETPFDVPANHYLLIKDSTHVELITVDSEVRNV